MPKHVLYGRLTMNNRNRRDSVSAAMRAEAEARGFTAEGIGNYPAGTVVVDNNTFTFSYSHSDPAVVEKSENDLLALLSLNQFDNSDFGSQWVSD